jgi:hypothetical protein
MCPSCSASILGEYDSPNVAVISFRGWKPPAHCHQCGKPYPWTERRAAALADAIDEVDELSQIERDKLKQSIPDVLSKTPGTDTAVARFKKAIKKGGDVGGKLLSDVLAKVAAEVVTKSITGG